MRVLGSKRRINQFANRPDMIGQPKRDRWRAQNRFMLAAEIIVSDVQINGRRVAFDLLEKPFVNRVNRRDSVRSVRLLRSTNLVEISAGTPWMASRAMATTCAGL
jgi:hypothetical protein